MASNPVRTTSERLTGAAQRVIVSRASSPGVHAEFEKLRPRARHDDGVRMPNDDVVLCRPPRAEQPTHPSHGEHQRTLVPQTITVGTGQAPYRLEPLERVEDAAGNNDQLGTPLRDEGESAEAARGIEPLYRALQALA
jgi:hypothetical protein